MTRREACGRQQTQQMKIETRASALLVEKRFYRVFMVYTIIREDIVLHQVVEALPWRSMHGHMVACCFVASGFGRRQKKIEMDSSIFWREKIQNRNRLLDLAGSSNRNGLLDLAGRNFVKLNSPDILAGNFSQIKFARTSWRPGNSASFILLPHIYYRFLVFARLVSDHSTYQVSDILRKQRMR